MTAAIVTTITSAQVIAGRQYHQPAIQVIVLAFHQRLYNVGTCISHRSKHKHHAGTTNSSRCCETALKIFLVEKIVHITKEPQRTRFASERQRVACAQISLGYPAKAIATAGESHRVEDRREIVTRRGEIKIDQEPATESLGRNHRKLMIGNDQGTTSALHLWRPLLRLRVRIGS